MDAGKNKQPYNLSSALGMSLKTTEAHGSHLWRNPFMEKPIYGRFIARTATDSNIQT